MERGYVYQPAELFAKMGFAQESHMEFLLKISLKFLLKCYHNSHEMKNKIYFVVLFPL